MEEDIIVGGEETLSQEYDLGDPVIDFDPRCTTRIEDLCQETFDCDCGEDSCKGLSRNEVNLIDVTSGGEDRRWVIRKGNVKCYDTVDAKIEAAKVVE